ncbi:MAG: short-chain fatty acid transporter [Deltaproteobacteria bacterium]|nr:short-chain fatty acid transporter [Deltaproteobacteria bacterium]MBM4393867.1 short-chain fatty acid transporter [Deltaproteobacteria bacterium]
MHAANPVERLALRATSLAERYMPDAFVFALGATLLTLGGALLVDPAMQADPSKLVLAWGNGFWELIRFTLQMCMIVIGGYVLASSPPVARLIERLAELPRTGRGAVALVAFAAMISSLLNWGFSLVFGALFARAAARRRPDADYRALAAASFLGLGTVWAQGLSGSAALQMASPSSMPKALVEIVGDPIPLTETIFRWQSIACVAIEVVVVTWVAWLAAPGPERAKNAAALGVDLRDEAPAPGGACTPGERFEHSPALLLPVVLLGFSYLFLSIRARSTGIADALNALDFNTINLFLLMLGGLLHWTPASLMRAVKDATPAAWGVLLQFPFYGGIFGVMTGSQLSHAIASVFVHASNATFYPAVIVTYSAVLGMFVPSGGSKWVIEAPYVLQAARQLGVPDGWMVVSYDLGEAIANLCQPFWMLPILALLGLKARDIMGFTWLVALVLFPLVLVLVTVFCPAP